MDCGELSSTILKVLRPLDDPRTEDFYRYIILTGKAVVSYNDRICVYIKHDTGLECVLPAKKFYSVLPKTGEADISLKSGKLIIKTGTTTAKMNTVDAPDLMARVKTMKLKKKRKWKKLPPDFLKGLSMCCPSASKEMNEPAMTCVLINNDIVAATDEVRISEYKMEGSINAEVLIPAKTVNELIMYDGLTKYSIEDRWIYFADDSKSRKFCARLIEAEFPDYDSHFQFDEVAEVVLPVQETIEAVRYVAPMAVEDEHGFAWMKVYINKKVVTFTTNDPEVGEAKATVKMRTALKKTAPIYINPGFLVHIIRDAHRMILGADRAKFETENFTHLVALLKEVDDAEDN